MPEWPGASWDKRAVNENARRFLGIPQEHGGPSMMETPGVSRPASGMIWGAEDHQARCGKMPYELARPEAPLTRQVKGKDLRGLSVGFLAPVA